MISNTAHPAREGAVPAGPERRCVTSAELLQGRRQILILHDGQEYRLQVTKNGKLILTK